MFNQLIEDMRNALSATDSEVGLVDDTVFRLAWTEYYFNRGYELIKHGTKTPADVRGTEEGGVFTINAVGRAAHLTVPIIIDHVKAVASKHPDGVRKIFICGAVGGWIAPYLAYRLAREGHHSMLFWRPYEGETGEPPATLILSAGAVEGEVSPLFITPGAPWRKEKRDKLLVGDVPIALVDALHEIFQPVARSKESVLALAVASDSMDSQFHEYVPLAEVVDSFGLAGGTPQLLDVSHASRDAD